jgi:MscS family membrane protein
MRQVLEGIERVLREHPKQFDKNEITVRFMALGQSSLDLEVICMFATSDYSEFRAIRQEMLLAIMEIVEKAGTSFAFPTRTVHVASIPAKAA